MLNNKNFKLATMLLVFLVLLAITLDEVTTRFPMGNVSIGLVVMFFVSVVPALGKPIYIWMTAENEEDSAKREALERSRTIKALCITGVFLLAVLAYEVPKHLL